MTMRHLLQLALVISCAILFENISQSESSVLYKTRFKDLPDIEKEKTAIDEYLFFLYSLQYVERKYDTRDSICTTIERLNIQLCIIIV